MSDDSSRNTTPAWPEPTAKVPTAQRDILALWENSDPNKPVDAAVLVAALQKRGHSASAAHWAIHRMIGDGRLLAEGRHISPCSSGMTASGTPYFVVGTTIYPGGWQDYRNFQVRPTEKFWAWAQEPEPATAAQDIPGGDAPAKDKGNGPELLTPEARAILFVQEQLKTTGKVPTKTAIAKALDVDRRTLNNWSAFKVAYQRLQSENRRQPPKGTKAKDGTLEAWRESGK